MIRGALLDKGKLQRQQSFKVLRLFNDIDGKIMSKMLFLKSGLILAAANSRLVHHIKFPNNQCPVCYKVFANISHIHRHYVEIHMRRAEFVCQRCDRKFKRRYMMEHHLKTCRGERYHQCHICHTPYKSEEKLQKHVEDKHGYCESYP